MPNDEQKETDLPENTGEFRPEPDEGDLSKVGEIEGGGEFVPTQFGQAKFVYAAYMGAAIGIAFLIERFGNLAWHRLSQWKPALGEPRDDVLMPVAAVIAIAAAIYYWKFTRTRKLLEEVADELSKVTWPTRKDVGNSTTVVIFTTLFATVYFALMDRFWGFVTNLVYGS